MKSICPKCAARYDERIYKCPEDGAALVEDLAGAVLAGRYELQELIGVGGMDSTVWRGWQRSTERHVALKVLPPATGLAADRFRRGARIASRLNHPHITTVHDYGATEDGKLFLVMELLKGQPLRMFLRGGAALSLERGFTLAEQVLRALEHAHGRGVVHRDLKPDNLFVVPLESGADHIKILDFGIAKYFAEDPEQSTSEDSLQDHELTQEGRLCGTPLYMAPEQIMCTGVDARTDLYALGVILFRMFTGKLPFAGKSQYELFNQHLTHAPPPPSRARPDLELPTLLDELVLRALAKNPEHRFQTAKQMRDALRAARRQTLGDLEDSDEHSRPHIELSNTQSMLVGVYDVDQGVGTSTGTSQLRPVRGGSVMWLAAAAAVIVALVVALAWPSGRPAEAADADEGPPAVVQLERQADRPGTGAEEEAEPEAEPVSGSDQAAVPAEDAPDKPTPVHVSSAPSGATIAVGDEVLGVTPIDAELEPGTHTLTVNLEGHSPQTLKVVVAELPLRQHIALVKAPSPASIVTPDDARAVIAPADGDERAKAQVTRKRPTRKVAASSKKKTAPKKPAAKRASDEANKPAGAEQAPASEVKATPPAPKKVKPKIQLLDE